MIGDAALRRMLRSRRAGIIFASHGVATSFRNRATEEVHIPFEDFRDIVDLLQQLDFDFLSMEEVIALARNGFRHPKHWVHLTFDDGYQNNCDVIHPFLAGRNVPFSVFVSTHYVQTGDRFPTFWLRLAEELDLPLQTAFPEHSLGRDPARSLFESALHFARFQQHFNTVERVKALFSPEQLSKLPEHQNDAPMSVESLKALAADPRVHIGSHSHHHVIFHQDQDPGVARDNLLESIRLLRDEWRVSRDVTFCFPNGDWAPQWVELLRSTGIPLAFCSATGFVDQAVEPLLMPRFWLSNVRRVRLICALAVIGNNSLYAFGRRPPPRARTEFSKHRNPWPKKPSPAGRSCRPRPGHGRSESVRPAEGPLAQAAVKSGPIAPCCLAPATD